MKLTLDGMKLRVLWSFRFFRWRVVKATLEQETCDDFPTYTVSVATSG